MIVYHGSHLAVTHPDTHHSRAKVDFGPGFYVTPIRAQAENWTRKHSRKGLGAVVSRYELNEERARSYDVLEFKSYSETWLEFVAKCRLGDDASSHDIVIDGVADDRVFDTVELYLSGLIAKSEAIGRLAIAKPNMQICFRSQEVIDACLEYLGCDAL